MSGPGPGVLALVLGVLIVAPACDDTGEQARSAAAADELRSVALRVEGMHCEACVDAIERALVKVDGVDSATVEYPSGRAMVRARASVEPAALVSAVDALGYGASVVDAETIATH